MIILDTRPFMIISQIDTDEGGRWSASMMMSDIGHMIEMDAVVGENQEIRLGFI